MAPVGGDGHDYTTLSKIPIVIRSFVEIIIRNTTLHIFRPYKVTRPRKRHFIAVDTENDPKTGRFICASVYGERIDHHGRIHHVEKFFEAQEEFVFFLDKVTTSGGKNTSCTVVGFNTDYDLIYFQDIVDTRTKLYAMGHFISCKLKNGTDVLDLTRFTFIGGLGDWIEWCKFDEKYGVHKLGLEHLAARNMNDAKATFYLAEFIQDFFKENFNTSMRRTLPATALAVFRGMTDCYWYRDDSQQFLNDYERKAYHGGRTELFERGEHEYRSFDVNSMYLSLMREEDLPDPSTAEYHPDGYGFNAWVKKGHLLIADVTVIIPPQKVAPLPFKDKKLIFPVGIFRGHYTSIELKEAVHYGGKIKKVHSYIVYHKKGVWFKEYADMVWQGRLKAKKEGHKGIDEMYKRLGNSLYGKFAQANAEGGNWIRESDLGGIPEGTTPITDIRGDTWVYTGKSPRIDALHTFPCISAFITSYARVKLLHALKAHEKCVLYCDTDSIKIKAKCKPKIQISKKILGAWKDEGRHTAKFIRAKWYGSVCKGVPKKAVYIGKDDEGREQFKFESPIKFRASFRQHKPQNLWVEIVKHLVPIDDKRLWSGDKSKPLVVNAISPQ